MLVGLILLRSLDLTNPRPPRPPQKYCLAYSQTATADYVLRAIGLLGPLPVVQIEFNSMQEQTHETFAQTRTPKAGRRTLTTTTTTREPVTIMATGSSSSNSRATINLSTRTWGAEHQKQQAVVRLIPRICFMLSRFRDNFGGSLNWRRRAIWSSSVSQSVGDKQHGHESGLWSWTGDDDVPLLIYGSSAGRVDGGNVTTTNERTSSNRHPNSW